MKEPIYKLIANMYGVNFPVGVDSLKGCKGCLSTRMCVIMSGWHA
jgi:hypothetical protein